MLDHSWLITKMAPVYRNEYKGPAIIAIITHPDFLVELVAGINNTCDKSIISLNSLPSTEMSVGMAG